MPDRRTPTSSTPLKPSGTQPPETSDSGRLSTCRICGALFDELDPESLLNHLDPTHEPPDVA
jgi:hypothetical protein